MSEYQLQTELSDETKREMILYAEKNTLETAVEDQSKAIAKSVRKTGRLFSFIILANVLLSFLWQQPADFFVVIVYGICYVAEIIWLFFGLQKRRQELEEWKIAHENEFQY